MILERGVSEYSNSGQSEVFLATQEIKMYNTDITKYVVYNDMIEEVREYIQCESADLELFKAYV